MTCRDITFAWANVDPVTELLEDLTGIPWRGRDKYGRITATQGQGRDIPALIAQKHPDLCGKNLRDFFGVSGSGAWFFRHSEYNVSALKALLREARMRKLWLENLMAGTLASSHHLLEGVVELAPDLQKELLSMF
jgi:hypothetical protein